MRRFDSFLILGVANRETLSLPPSRFESYTLAVVSRVYSIFTYTVNNGWEHGSNPCVKWFFNADGHPRIVTSSSVVVSRVYSGVAQLVERVAVNHCLSGDRDPPPEPATLGKENGDPERS